MVCKAKVSGPRKPPKPVITPGPSRVPDPEVGRHDDCQRRIGCTCRACCWENGSGKIRDPDTGLVR